MKELSININYKKLSDTINAMSVERYLSKIESFEGKKILVTGGTSGIGLELVKILATKKAAIVLLARNIEKAQKVKESLHYDNIDVIRYDQSDYQLIDNAVKEIKEKHSDFDSIVLNAGILLPPKGEVSKQGYPLTIDTNYLGLKRFVDQLIPLFKSKRFIFQGSMAASFIHDKKFDILSDKYPLFKQYNLSKSCVESLWYHYYLENKENEFILTEPGVSNTDIFRSFKQPIKTLGKGFVTIFSHSPKKASLTLLKGLETTSNNGDFYVPRGLFTIFGYPKKKKFPNNRKRLFLIK